MLIRFWNSTFNSNIQSRKVSSSKWCSALHRNLNDMVSFSMENVLFKVLRFHCNLRAIGKTWYKILRWKVLLKYFFSKIQSSSPKAPGVLTSWHLCTNRVIHPHQFQASSNFILTKLKTQWTAKYEKIEHFAFASIKYTLSVLHQILNLYYVPLSFTVTSASIVIIHIYNKNSTCHLAFVFLFCFKVLSPNIQMWATF